LWYLTPLLAIFHLYLGGQFYLWSTPRLNRIRTCIVIVVIGTDCIGYYKSNYCTYNVSYILIKFSLLNSRGCHGRNRTVVGFIITYAISTYHNYNDASSNPVQASANIQIGICVGILFRYISRFPLNSQNTYKAMQLDTHYHLIEIYTATS
jgi:hypothetical protein